MRLLSAFVFASCSAAAGAVALVACSDETTSSPSSALDGSTDGRTNGRTDGGDEEDDAATGTDAGKDAAKDARSTRDANGPGEAGTECIFNHDCQLALHCSACDAGYCYCTPGTRGTGRNGIDACDAGEQCASALCVEGPGDSGVSYCSDECESNAECTGMLPKCVSIPSFADFCARDPG